MTTPPKRENLWVNLLLNVVLPSLILTKGAEWFRWAPPVVLVTALSLPLVYGLYDFFTRRKVNMFSIIGFVSVLITGAVGLIDNIPTRLIAIKEAAVPLLFALAILASSFTRKPLLRSLLFSPEIFDVQLIEASLDERGTRDDFESTIKSCTGWVVGSFFLSSILNYVLAAWIVNSPSGTEAFNAEVGRMTALSWPVIALPSTAVMMVALVKLMKGIESTTGHPLDDVLHPEVRQKMEAKEQKRGQTTEDRGQDLSGKRETDAKD
jgi:hypothetical protein